MSKNVKEPFLKARVINLVMGLVILGLILLVLFKGEQTGVYEMLIFCLAAVSNFVAATISFSEQKRIRGNLCAVLCAVFFVVAVIRAVQMFLSV